MFVRPGSSRRLKATGGRSVPPRTLPEATGVPTQPDPSVIDTNDSIVFKTVDLPPRTFSAAGLLFTADLDGGNLGGVVTGGEADTDGIDIFDLYIAPDCHGRPPLTCLTAFSPAI